MIKKAVIPAAGLGTSFLLIKMLCDSDSEIVYEQLPQDDLMQRKQDISKAKAILGWKPKVGLEQGLKKTIEWFGEREK